MVEIPGPLPARPPTPPRPGSRTDENEQQSANLLQTPEASVRPANATKLPPSSHGSKRVNFSPWLHTVIGSPKSDSSGKHPATNLPAKAHTESSKRIEGKAFKSILKETSSPIPVWSPNVNRFTTQSIDMLLESVVQQLAGESISSRLDAYMNLFNALRTYDSLPGGKEIGEKLGLITDFIQRDVTRDLVHGTPMDTTLANQALKLSAAFIWQQDISSQLPEDFKAFLVEHAITSLQENKGAKSVLTHYLSILSTQNFSAKIMTTSRIIRLLTALQDLSKHVTGKAISFHRLSIYQRLLSQFKSTFISQSSSWMEHLVFGLLHSHKETRIKAIALGFQISVTAGPTPSLSSTVRQLFDRPLEGNRKLVTEIKERMSRMVATLDTGMHVPQIWSIIVLLLRSKKWTLDQWEHFKEWVLVLQRCFNCSEPAIKSQAIVAWNRFIYAVSPNENTSRSLLKMLGKPVFSQFERKKSDKPGAKPAQLALSSYYHLLYYAFRPSLPYHHVDVIWEEYVAIPSATILSSHPGLSNTTALVVSNLLWSPQAKVWAETRITDNARMEVEELPSLEPRWVRARVSVVLEVFESLFKTSVWNTEAIHESNIAIAWKSLANALSLASSKEITPSGESMQAVGSVLGFLHRLWAAGPSGLNAMGEDAQDTFCERFRFLSKTMIVSLGGVPFTEKLMLLTEDGVFQSSATPTHRSPPSSTNLHSPAIHLLRLISRDLTIPSPAPSYSRLVHGLIRASCDARISRGSRLEFLKQCAEVSAGDSVNAARESPLLATVWTETAKAAACALNTFPIEPVRERIGVASRDHEIITDILLTGVDLFPDAISDWSCLLNDYSRVVRTEKDDIAVVELVVEPIARHLSTMAVFDTYLPTSFLLSHCLSVHFVPQAEHEVGESSPDSIRSPDFPDGLWTTIGRSLELGYRNIITSHLPRLAAFVESLASFFSSAPPLCCVQAAEIVQAPLALWIEDAEGKLFAPRGEDDLITFAHRALSTSLFNFLRSTVYDTHLLLPKFEVLICAGLNSSHNSTSQQFVDFLCAAKTHLESPTSHTTMGQALSAATARLANQAEPPSPESESSTSLLDSLASFDDSASQNSHEASVDPDGPSPELGFNDHALPEPTELGEPQLPTYSGPENSDVPAALQKSRREMFRMIESIRSSSPANSPAENEAGFIASSPTPATRDQTPVVKSNPPGTKLPDSMEQDLPDLASSPPGATSQNRSPKKLSSSSRRAKRRKLLQSSLAASSKKTESSSHMNERPPSRRTRSSQTLDGPINSHSDTVTAPTIASGSTMGAGNQAASNQERSKSSSKKRKRKESVKPAPPENQRLSQEPQTPLVQKYHADSSSEDMESQIASQLEQDMELANDMATDVSALGTQTLKALTSKKRKREDDGEKTGVADRRRSTRLSTAKGAMAQDTDEPELIHTAAATGSQQSGTRSVSSLSPTMTRRMTRSSQKRENDLCITDLAPEAEILEAKQEALEDVPPEPPAKKSRKAACLEDQSAPSQKRNAPRSKNSRSSRSRRSRSSQAELKTNPVSPHTERDSSHSVLEAEPALVANASMDALASESVDASMDASAQQPVPAVASNVTTLTQESTEALAMAVGSMDMPESPVIREETMEVDALSNPPSAETADMVLDLTTATVETEPVSPTRESDNSGVGISKSLRSLLSEIKTASLGPTALREIDDLLFHIRVEAHEASRRHDNLA
ncbi:hypothetical protein POX_b02424 [Penicillium oxalicum]|uniref:hypothetical protein n=1 Tax=Penicillium oxalicum TaxID=69781 RepID=UPI0020B655EF|nr:hypothetical protein POX_b02424 [Penicillium oxalicum]KAI2792387.1 hypothetical protein POX_b02424 [Penicillium oxalicum]